MLYIFHVYSCYKIGKVLAELVDVNTLTQSHCRQVFNFEDVLKLANRISQLNFTFKKMSAGHSNAFSLVLRISRGLKSSRFFLGEVPLNDTQDNDATCSLPQQSINYI